VILNFSASAGQGGRIEKSGEWDRIRDGKWVFIALLPESLPAKGELKLRDYFDYALSVGALKPDWILSSIEAGTEIAFGKGEVTFKRFVVH
jgi:hypothetical protein